MLPKRHWTPRYVANRLALMLDAKIKPRNPWLTADSVRLLSQLIKPTDVGVEFGSGRSTVWFAARLAHLTSVEDNSKWFDLVTRQIESCGLGGRISYKLRSTPDDYVGEALCLPDESIDFCLIDGIERDRCAEAMLPKMRSGGLFVVDNVNWFIPNLHTKSPASLRKSHYTEGWQRIAGQLSSWRRVWTSNGVTDTAIWFKP